MGKIFDALEKADARLGKRTPPQRKRTPSQRNRTPSQRNKETTESIKKSHEKIVALTNLNQNTQKLELFKDLVTYHAPQSVEAELFKALRTNLLFPTDRQTPKTILVTSPLPGDGKSFTSANLSISIARGVEEHVMLIDCDLRKPTIHTLFGYKQVVGLSDYLALDIDLANALLKTPIEKLTLLPAGRLPKNPTELVSSKKMKMLLEEVKARYDDRYIIIDSPPPSMAAETNAILKYVDGVLVVVKAGRTPRNAVKQLVEQIGKDKMLGIVLNNAGQTAKKYYGYGKSYYKIEED